MIQAIMDLPQGRAFIFDLLEFCQIGHSVFATNALIMAHQSGKQNVGLKVQGEVMALAPERYLEMLKEADERAKAPLLAESNGSDQETING